jgi:hypothetical protein
MNQIDLARLRGKFKKPGGGVRHGMRLAGIFEIWQWRRNPLGLWKVVDHDITRNLVTNEGLDAILDIMFHADTQITTWYVTIVETNTAPAAGLTYAVPTYTESTAYDEGTRPEYVEAAASGQSMDNSASKAQFTISATKTIYGSSLVGGGSAPTTKADTAGGGTLFCYALYASSKAVVDDDVLNVQYTLTAADDGA